MKRIPVYTHQALGLIIALFGATVVLRWIFQLDAVARLIPGSESMGLNSPLLFLSAGIFCTLFPTRWPPLQPLLKLCILLLLLLPGLTMIQHLSGVSLGIDFVRMPTAPTASIPYPGRMAPNTTLAFLCTGLTLLLLSRPQRGRSSERVITAAISITMLVGFAALAGYFMRLDMLYHIATFNKMLMPTAAGMSMLGCCLWLLRQRLHHVRGATASAYQRRIIWRAGAVLTVVALAAGVAGFAVVRNVLEKALTDNMLFATTTNATSMANLLEDRLAFHQTIVTRPIVQRHFAQLADNPQDPQAREFLQNTATNLLTAGPTGVRLLDTSGRTVAASGTLLRDRAAVAHALRSTGRGTSYLVWQDRYYLYAEAPAMANGRQVGTIITEQPMPAFDRLMQVIRNSGDSTDVLLCSHSQGAALCAPSRFNPTVTRVPALREGKLHDLPVHHALLGQSGVRALHDLRNVPVFAAYSPLQDFGLGLVIKMDSDSMYAPLKEQTQLLTALLVALVALGTAAANLAVRPLLDRIEQDVSELRVAEEKLAGSEKRLRAIADNLPVLISYIDSKQTYRFVNRTFEAWTGKPPQQVLNRDVAEVLGEEKFAARRDKLARALAGERVEFELATMGAGVLRQLHTIYIPDRAADGAVQGIYTLSTDITALHAAQEQLQAMARFDALTGLPNRYLMNEKLLEAIARCRRSGAPMAVMFLDIDHFKTINDSLGHAAGDAVLKEFGRRLKASVRETDMVCRLAGDEFLIILENLGSAAETENIATKILANASAPCEILAQPLRISTSIGIAYCDGQPLLPDALIDQADQALYQAKQGGRATFRMRLC
ncbi:diguanylate cyclase [Janthinobacterium sp. 17J80-10]|uniref:diguanylate cyclase domain-containing protein n=1 Tax=Janthinobacterium sp. 17J80-10 TaxID=2497863 RepID=UPI0013E8B253|nr:diguanylate cyclase [Janthinobacterium sp. 17J80-10]